MSLISDIISGIIAPVTNTITAIYTKKEDAQVATAKVDAGVASSWIKVVGKNLGNTILILAELSFIVPLAVFFAKSVLWDNIISYVLYGKYGYTPHLQGDVKDWAGWIMGYLFLKVTTKGYR